MEPLLLTRIYWVAFAGAICVAVYGLRAVLNGIGPGSKDAMLLLQLVPGAMLAGGMALAMLLSAIVYFTHSRVASGICLTLLVLTVFVLEVPAIWISSSISESKPAAATQIPAP